MLWTFKKMVLCLLAFSKTWLKGGKKVVNRITIAEISAVNSKLRRFGFKTYLQLFNKIEIEQDVSIQAKLSLNTEKISFRKSETSRFMTSNCGLWLAGHLCTCHGKN